MPIHGLEWLFITIIVVVLVLWDPQKIPQIARALAEAKREYEKATSTMQELAQLYEGELEDTEESDEKLLEVAKNLGIETYGKTKDEIKEEILKRAQEKTEAESEGRETQEQKREEGPGEAGTEREGPDLPYIGS
ncbi:MAG: twin-arginine translocase TatA/TatE family subunit [Thaumarchaeota archaeon]|nr:twin-arginine translocase TatA/TatE family subunit [Nitrososphaerota archaeon]